MHNHCKIRLLIPFLFVFICFPKSLFAQEKEIDMEEREAYLLQIRNDFREIAFKHTERTYVLADSFNQELIKTLRLPESFGYAFDSLKTKIGIQASRDGNLKVYSWYHSYGGNWHDIRSFAQIKTNQGFAYEILHNGYTEGEKIFNDVSYGPIQSLLTKNGLIYLLRGWGTHGSGHNHLTMRAFWIRGGKLEECEGVFDGETYLVQEIPRGDKLDLAYDPE
ncbi:MAG: hypothetical protein AAGD28_19555, partial [Bacteroidota bacterium]